VLALPDDNDDYILDTDASDYGLGAVLSQVKNGQENYSPTTTTMSRLIKYTSYNIIMSKC